MCSWSYKQLDMGFEIRSVSYQNPSPQQLIDNHKNNNNHTNINIAANIGQHAMSFISSSTVFPLILTTSLGRKMATYYLSFTNEKVETCSYHIGNQLSHLEAWLTTQLNTTQSCLLN